MSVSSPSHVDDISPASARATVRFLVNGREWVLENPHPTLLLVDWLRTPEVGLTGTKKGCGQGGCGACTVMLSRRDQETGEVRHEAINSCLRPVCSLDGMVVTTTEGVGGTETLLNPVQYRIAKENGSQCGYCTPGWVMSMTSFLTANPHRKATQEEIERLFDGNLCRCTGFRPILYAMRHFASDWTPRDEEGSMTCLAPEVKHACAVEAVHAQPAALPLKPLQITKDGVTWYRPDSLSTVLDLLAELPADEVKLVNGNTSIGIYDRYQEKSKYLIDISGLAILKHHSTTSQWMTLGAGMTYNELLEYLERIRDAGEGDDVTAALHYMAHRTAGMIVRNVATLAGNTMLVVRHMLDGVPFPSDLFTALAAVGAYVTLEGKGEEGPRTMPILEFARAWQTDPALRRMVLVRYLVPRLPAGIHVRTYKVALREVNAHSIVNAGMWVSFKESGLVDEASIVFGGIAPIAFRAAETEGALAKRPWNGETLQIALAALQRDIDGALDFWRDRLSTVPDEGFTDAYRCHLAQSFLYKFFIEVAEATGSTPIPSEIASAGERAVRPLSRGTQSIPYNPDHPPVGQPYIKLDAFLQASGEAKYIHDLPLPPRGVNGAFVLSSKALGTFDFQIPDNPAVKVEAKVLTAWLKQRYPDLVDLLTAADIPPRQNNRTAAIATKTGGVDPLLADGKIEWYGQPIALALAENETYAIDVAHYVRTHCIYYDPGFAEQPILTIEQAKAAGSLLVDTTVPPYNHILYVERPKSQLDWVGTTGEKVVNSSLCLIVNGTQRSGAQAHYYMETQSVLAIPGEQGQMTIHPSSQSPDTVQSTVASVLGVPLSNVTVSMRRIGGGYGGKTTRSPFVAAPAAVAAAKLKRPVRIAVRREEDMEMFGRRHPFHSEYSLAVATEQDAGGPRGRILGSVMTFYSDGGATYDCSFTVMDCVQMRIDSGYMVPNWKTSGEVARTNQATNTAFRSMGLIQGVLVLEDAIAHAAHDLGMRAEDMREINLYRPGDTTVVGTKLTVCYIREVFEHLRAKVEFDRRAVEIDRFNRANRWRKRGIAMIPVQYGAGYNAAFLEQAGALIDVYGQDGSVLVHQGGVEMGQGLATKIAQVAAEALNVPLDFITMAETDLRVVPNPVGTGASTGTGFNADAVRAACVELQRRLEAFCREQYELTKGKPNQHFDFWTYPDGWASPIRASAGQKPELVWQWIIGKAHFSRVNLSAQSRIAWPGGTAAAENLYYHDSLTAEQGVDQFTGYTFSAACSEVEIDVLTGETTVLRADLVYDIGNSLNAAVDIGQIEGAFVQGIGYVLTEDIVTEPDGPHAGRLNTNNTWGYKLPATTTIPVEFNVGFVPRDERRGRPEHNMVLGSKEVGEPPLVLAVSVYLAVKNAVLAARRDRGDNSWFVLEAPATVQRVREACLVEARDLTV